MAYPWSYNDTRILFRSGVLEDFTDYAQALSAGYEEANAICSYRKLDSGIFIEDLTEPETRKYQRGNVLVYRFSDRKQIVSNARKNSLFAGEVLHSHPVTMGDWYRYQQGECTIDELVGFYSALSFGDFYMMGKNREHFRGVIVAHPEFVTRPFFWFVDPETLEVTLARDENIVCGP